MKMKAFLPVAAAAILSLAAIAPAAHAEDGNNAAGAAALGFFVGALVGQASQPYATAPRVSYRPGVRVVVPQGRYHRGYGWHRHRDYRNYAYRQRAPRRFGHHDFHQRWHHDSHGYQSRWHHARRNYGSWHGNDHQRWHHGGDH